MGKLGILKNISLIVALIIAVYIVGNYSGFMKSSIMQIFNIPGSSVQGASTEKGHEISEKIGSDIGTEVGTMQEQIMNLKISDAVSGVSRLQKISKDMKAIEAFTKEQIHSMLQSKK